MTYTCSVYIFYLDKLKPVKFVIEVNDNILCTMHGAVVIHVVAYIYNIVLCVQK